jgi:hypothetical protein
MISDEKILVFLMKKKRKKCRKMVHWHGPMPGLPARRILISRPSSSPPIHKPVSLSTTGLLLPFRLSLLLVEHVFVKTFVIYPCHVLSLPRKTTQKQHKKERKSKKRDLNSRETTFYFFLWC